MRWIIGFTLLAVSALAITGNIVGGLRARRAGRGFSFVPFIAAALGSIGAIVLPVGGRTWLIAGVLLLDFTVPLGLVVCSPGTRSVFSVAICDGRAGFAAVANQLVRAIVADDILRRGSAAP